jgi:hypothetical protein
MSVFIVGLSCVAGAAAIMAAITYFLRKSKSPDEVEGSENNTLSGQVFGIVGGLHAVLIAFILIGLLDNANSASDESYREAGGLIAVDWAAKSLPADARVKIQQLTRAYATTVSEKEWPRMADGEKVEKPGWTQLEQLSTVVSGVEVSEDWQKSRQQEATEKLWDVYEARQERLNAVNNGGVSPVIWFALALGTLLTVGLPLLFGGTKLRTHIIVVSTLTATLTLLLFAIYQLQNPFTGGAAVGPDAFQSVLERLK